jgi:hypothetical protein
MKICVVSLNMSRGEEIASLFSLKNISYEYFFKGIGYQTSLGKYEENINGAKEYFDSKYANVDAFIEFPSSFIHQYAFEKDNNTKFIFIDISKEAWLEKMNYVKDLYVSHVPDYLFEEFFCNFYQQTGKTNMLDLTNEELSTIYDAQVSSINSNLSSNPNFIKIDYDDPDLINKISQFLNI